MPQSVTVSVSGLTNGDLPRRLAVTLQHQYSYDSTPAVDIGNVDQRFQAGLTIDF